MSMPSEIFSTQAVSCHGSGLISSTTASPTGGVYSHAEAYPIQLLRRLREHRMLTNDEARKDPWDPIKIPLHPQLLLGASMRPHHHQHHQHSMSSLPGMALPWQPSHEEDEDAFRLRSSCFVSTRGTLSDDNEEESLENQLDCHWQKELDGLLQEQLRRHRRPGSVSSSCSSSSEDEDREDTMVSCSSAPKNSPGSSVADSPSAASTQVPVAVASGLPITFAPAYTNYAQEGNQRKALAAAKAPGASPTAEDASPKVPPSFGFVVDAASAGVRFLPPPGLEAPVLSDEELDGELWPSTTTTLMLRNVPNRYTPEELLHDMINAGFEQAFDFFYLPTDFATKKNKGYAFLNLCTPLLARRFRNMFHGKSLTRYSTKKVLELSPAVTQGFEANALKYLKHQSSRVQNPWFKPMIFSIEEEVNGGSTWKCLPLAEDHLPASTRQLLAVTTAAPARGGCSNNNNNTTNATCGSAAAVKEAQQPADEADGEAEAEAEAEDESENIGTEETSPSIGRRTRRRGGRRSHRTGASAPSACSISAPPGLEEM